MRWVMVWGVSVLLSAVGLAQEGQGLYHAGWVDFNKNGRKDVYENPSADVEKRLDDLIAQMTKWCSCTSTTALAA